MSTGPTIDYEALQQEAMRGVVRAALQFVVANGLPGEHHFYISFLTQAPGVVLSKRLREKYPQEMTIVLQHRFWDLIVTDERFEVKLTFDGIPERLVIPFSAIRVFIDPSVRYGLQFDEQIVEHEVPAQAVSMDAAFDQVGEAQGDTARPTTKKPRAPRKPKVDKGGAAAATRQNIPVAPQPQPASAAAGAPAVDEAGDEPAPDDGGAKILSFSHFKKK